MQSGANPDDLAMAICARYGNDPALLIEILHDVQEAVGFVPEAALPAIANSLNIARAEVHGVVSFYHDFRSAPAEGAVVKLCQAEACQAMGANALAAGLRDVPGLTVQPVYCLGNCALAPAAMIDNQLVGRVTAAELAQFADAAVEAEP